MRKPKISIAERDRILIAVYLARNVMMMLHGETVTLGRQCGGLNLQKDIFRLTEALQSLGISPSFPVLEYSLCQV